MGAGRVRSSNRNFLSHRYRSLNITSTIVVYRFVGECVAPCAWLTLFSAAAAEERGVEGAKTAIQQCAALGFFAWNLLHDRNLGNYPPVEPGPFCPDDDERLKYVAFLTDPANTERRDGLRLYLSRNFLFMTFKRPPRRPTRPTADAHSRFRSMSTRPPSASPAVRRTLSPSAQVVEA